jgi:argininosuccinate synthase
MNERIKELAIQAGAQGIVKRDFIDVEKFAELIVRECYEHCKGQVLDKEVADTNELTYNDAVGDCANGLLQHFGVE